jgi:ATP-dependent DNA helicase RecQ
MRDSGYQDALQRHFGFPTFREGQEAVIEAVMSGRDCLAVMPTGGGKSLCFQLPAILRPGLTLVISPLIALMKDQVDGLQAGDIAATFVNSSLSAAERNRRLQDLAAGRYDLVYVAPERFRSPRFVEAVTAAGVDLFAVDEAHCVSMWGHDFRPDYLQLAEALTRLGEPQVLCLTATATPEVREDIVGQLGLGVGPRAAPEVVVRGFARPSLTLTVSRVRGQDDKYSRTRAVVAEHRTGIVYCATRRNVEKVAARLRADGVRCVGYHAGMGDETRRETQERFVSGEVDVVVATNAFGMGIDRADLRFIVHWEVPGSLEAYYQEAGRAGRDGDQAHCELLYNYADVRTQEFFIDGSNPSPGLVRGLGLEVARLAGPQGDPVPAAVAFSQLTTGGRVNEMALGTALGILGRLDVVRRVPDIDGGPPLLMPGPAAAELDDMDLDFLREKADRDRSRLLRLLRFVNTKECRHATILRYFGDPSATGICGNRCDCCLRRSGAARLAGRAPTENEWLQVQKALSAVARLGGRFGQTRVAQVLAGSKDQAVLRAGLDQSSTYGLLADLTIKAIRGLLDALEDTECIESVGDEYPTIRLTDYGRQVMRRETTVSLVLPEPPPSPSASAPASSKPARKRSATLAEAVAEEDASPEDALQIARLAEALQTWRREQAAARGKPAFTVFSNATLAEIARHRPTDEPALLAVKGIGPAKLAEYGKDILTIVQEHLGAAAAADDD